MIQNLFQYNKKNAICKGANCIFFVFFFYFIFLLHITNI